MSDKKAIFHKGQPVNPEGFGQQQGNPGGFGQQPMSTGGFGQQQGNPMYGDTPSSLRIINAPADANLNRFAMLHDGSTYRLYCFKAGSQDTLYQFAWDGSAYAFGHNATPMIKIKSIPANADMNRFTMLHDGSTYRLYCFKIGSRDTLYQFTWDGSAYVFGYNAMPEIKITEIPADADMNSLAILSDDNESYRLYVQQFGNPDSMYQAAYVPGTEHYEFGYNSILQIPVISFPADTDYARWSMLHDGEAYRIYYMKQGSNDSLYQGTFNQEMNAYQFCN